MLKHEDQQGECILSCNNQTSSFAEDSREVLRKAGFSDSETDLFVERAVGVLDDYTAFFGEGTKLVYLIRKGLLKVELRIMIPGESLDPFIEGNGAKDRSFEKVCGINLNAGSFGISYKYIMGCNIISISIPLEGKSRNIIRDPVVWGVLLGIVFGFLCRILPQEANESIINNIASPALNIILSLISGVMGPVIFISLISSIIALEDINNLTDLGFKIIGRFIGIILFLIAVSVVVSGLIFQNFGSGDTSFSFSLLFSLIFDIFPTNMIEPFLTNNTAQLVILGFLTGSGLLLLGDQVSELKRIIEQVNKWVMSVMQIILFTMPAIPFLSIMRTVASGKGKELLSGWKFVVASYIVFTVCIAAKAVKTSILSGIHIPKLWQLIKPVASVSFMTGSTTASLKRFYEVSEEDLKIKPSFSSFWIPMSTAMLSPKTAVNVVIASFMAAQMEAMPVSYAFIMILVIVTLELSTASPGIPAACAAVLKSFGLPIEYVGLISTYRLLTDNYGAACCISYNMLEEIEVSHKLGEIEKEQQHIFGKPLRGCRCAAVLFYG